MDAYVDGCRATWISTGQSDQDIQEIVLTTNLTPRKCLGFKTPCLDGAPWSRVALKVLRTSRERSCLRPLVVALARKLLIALWRFVIDGVMPEGAVMKPSI